LKHDKIRKKQDMVKKDINFSHKVNFSEIM